MDAPLLKIEESSKPFECPLFQDQDPWELGMWTNWQNCSQSKYARPGGRMPNQNIKLSGFPKFWVGELSARVAVPGTRSRHPTTKCSALRSQPQFLLNSYFQTRENLAQKNGLNWSIGSNECKRYGELFFCKVHQFNSSEPKNQLPSSPSTTLKAWSRLNSKKRQKVISGWLE